MIVKKIISPKIGDIVHRKRIAIFPKKIEYDGYVKTLLFHKYYQVYRYDYGWHRYSNGCRRWIEMWCLEKEMLEEDLSEYIEKLKNVPTNYDRSLSELIKANKIKR